MNLENSLFACGLTLTSFVLLGSPPLGAANPPGGQSELAKPTPKQLRFADWEVGAFFHYDLNPFTGQEHGGWNSLTEIKQ